MSNVKLKAAIKRLKNLEYWLDIDDELWDSFSVMEKSDHRHMQKEVALILEILTDQDDD